MAQAPTDTTVPSSDADKPVSNGQTPATSTTSTTADKQTVTAKKRLSDVGDKIKAFGKKAVESATKFVEETDEELQSIKSMDGLITMASKEFEQYIKQKHDTTDKVKALKKIADSFKDSHGIVFVASFNVAFTVGGSYGRGIVMKRISKNNWTLPLAIQEIEANVGFQLNVSREKYFYLLKNDQAIKNFQQKQNVKLGGKGFAGLGNLGIQASGDVKASKESLTTTTNDAQVVANTSASVGNVKGLALGINVNAGTFQPCDKINNATYGNFDIKKLFERGVGDVVLASSGSGSDSKDNSENNNDSGDSNVTDSASEKPSEDASKDASKDNVNTVKNAELLVKIGGFIKLMEDVIAKEEELAAKAKADKQNKEQAQKKDENDQNKDQNKDQDKSKDDEKNDQVEQSGPAGQ